MLAVRTPLMALLLLAACDGNPFVAPVDGGGGGGTPGALTVPAIVAQNLKSAAYTPGDDTIKVNMTSQDASALSATYTRNTDYDLDGYQAYTYQESSSNRYVLALVKETGSVKGLTAVEGGQFANYHGGGNFVRADLFSLGTGVAGKANYSGSYVGLMNIGTPVPGPGGDLDPTRSYRTVGRTLITADFTEMSVSGGIDNRQIVDPMVDANGNVDPSLDPALSTITLFETGITTSGTFAGKVRIGVTEVGDYAGLFAGLNSAQVAALLVFTPYTGSSVIKEHGLVVLDNCVDAGGPACP